MAKVKIYTTPTCHYCRQAKDFFKMNDVDYEEVNVAEDQQAREEMVARSGQMGVPVIEIEGEDEVMVGFDEKKVAEKLGI